MKPFMRPTDRARLAPVGWVSEPAGEWQGHAVEIVYDPRRHDVALIRGDTTDSVRSGIAQSGYRRIAVDGPQEMWVRDRVDTAQVRLDGLGRGHGHEQGLDTGLEPA